MDLYYILVIINHSSCYRDKVVIIGTYVLKEGFMLVDSHCHLGFEQLGGLGGYTQQILEQASSSGVTYMLNIAVAMEYFDSYIQFSKQYNNIFTALGVHPLYIEHNQSFSERDIVPYLNEQQFVALGETGLDYYHAKEQKRQQQDLFATHLYLAHKYKLPFIVHTREAQDDTIAILKEFIYQYDIKGVIHCFSGDVNFAKQLLDLNLYLSLSGIVTFPKATELHEVAKYIPADRLLLETDAPYLAPIPYRGKINQPAYVKHTAEYVAMQRNIDLQVIAKLTTDNFFTLFYKAMR